MKYMPMQVIDGHAVVQLPQGTAVVDSGFPGTLMRAPASVSRALGHRIDWLVGTKWLGQSPTLFDWPAARIAREVASHDFIGGEEVQLQPSLGVFLVPLISRIGAGVACLDTGAKLSYATKEAVQGLTPIGREKDFHPEFGEFEVDVYVLSITVGTRAFEGRFGLLPDMLRRSLTALGLDGWILGSPFFVGRRIVLDLAADRMLDVTDCAPNGEASSSCETSATSSPNGSFEKGRSKDDMPRSYDVAIRIMNAELSAGDQDLLRRLDDHDVIVIRGCHDRVEHVLRLAGIAHHVVQPQDVAMLDLTPHQLVFVNCPGEVNDRAIEVLRLFVESGGSLVTTDWALKHIVERAFPGVIARNGRSTGDEVVRVEVRDDSSPWLAGMFHEGADPLWWLEVASYPIRILDHGRVKVLLTSSELGARYGAASVAVTFDVGKGNVLHMISHYYLQRADPRTARHKKGWKDYAGEVGAEKVAKEAGSSFDDISAGEVEAAHKSLRFMTNMVLEKQRKNRT